MTDNRCTKLPRTIIKLYCAHWQLFWRIMLPVAILAISLDIAQFFRIATQTEKQVHNTVHIPSQPNLHTATSSINTRSGIISTISGTYSPSGVDWGFMPFPYFSATDSEGGTWEWGFKFKILDNVAFLFLFFFAFCPLSLAVARISSASQTSDNAELPPPTAREMWGHTGRKALTVFIAALLFMLAMSVSSFLILIFELAVPRVWSYRFELYLVMMFVHHIYIIYVMVMLSLYNPCLILEDNSVIGIFRRSYTLVNGIKFRFLGIYLLTSWITSVLIAVLLGVALLVFSMFVPELAPIRTALSSLKFLSLFIGVDLEVALPQVLGVAPTVAILIVKGLIATFLAPIWAILTTHLYFRRVDAARETV